MVVNCKLEYADLLRVRNLLDDRIEQLNETIKSYDGTKHQDFGDTFYNIKLGFINTSLRINKAIEQNN